MQLASLFIPMLWNDLQSSKLLLDISIVDFKTRLEDITPNTGCLILKIKIFNQDCHSNVLHCLQKRSTFLWVTLYLYNGYVIIASFGIVLWMDVHFLNCMILTMYCIYLKNPQKFVLGRFINWIDYIHYSTCLYVSNEIFSFICWTIDE